MNFTQGEIIFLSSAVSFVGIFVFWLIFMIVTSRKMKTILKTPSNDENKKDETR